MDNQRATNSQHKTLKTEERKREDRTPVRGAFLNAKLSQYLKTSGKKIITQHAISKVISHGQNNLVGNSSNKRIKLL